MEATMEAVAQCRVEEQWNEEERCALEAIITATEDTIKETRALIATIDQMLAKRH
jgi:hypothetical protein